jgi:hypothetical protein
MEPWWRSLSAALAGVAIGLPLYAWVVRDEVLGTGGQMAFFLFIAASVLLQRLGTGERAWPLRIAFALVAIAATFGVLWLVWPDFARAPLQRWDLPGFSISLPRGDVRVKEIERYERGTLQIRGAGGAAAATWEAGSELDDETAQMMVTMLMRGLGPTAGAAEEVAPATAGARTFSARMGDVTMIASLIPCGARNVTVIAGAPDADDARSVHRRTVATFECKPDPAREATATAPPPVRIDVPPGWQPIEMEPGQLAWEGEDGGVFFQYVRIGAAPSGKPFELMLAAMNGRVTGSEPLGDRTMWLGTIEADGETAGVASLTLRCGTEEVIGVYFGDTASPTARAVLSSARCD